MKLENISLAFLGAEVVILMVAAANQVGGSVFSSKENKLLPLTAVNRTQTAIRRCDCRAECHDDPLCTAFSSHALKPGRGLVQCRYSYLYLLESDFEDGEPGTEAWTFFKRRPCPDGYNYVAGTGCVTLLGKVSYTVAETMCPAGSQLASPPSDASYYHLMKYFNDYLIPLLGETKLYVYLGVKRINGVWTWLDGHVTPSQPGSSIWLAGDPNENADCAVMLFNSVAGYRGLLADGLCSGEARVLCAIV